jgi:hypothetical protein
VMHMKNLTKQPQLFFHKISIFLKTLIFFTALTKSSSLIATR